MEGKIKYLISAFLLLSFISFAQEAHTIAKILFTKSNELPNEHLYLCLNKPRYERADTIWFKLYDVIDGHKLSAISHVAYAELINPNDSIIQKLNLKLEAGMASGDFALPLRLLPGIYHIRGYTSWMRNQDSFYTRDVVIGNPDYEQSIVSSDNAGNNDRQKNVTGSTISNSNKLDIQFFPEGGELVEGLRNVVAYKAINPDGSPVMLNGTITGTDGEILAEIQSNANGMGTFAIKPQPGESYHAKLTFANGGFLEVRLPIAVPSGYTLTINNHNKDTLQIKVAANNEILKKVSGKSFYLIAQSGGNIYYTTSGKAVATAYKIKVAKDRFPTGITRFTLYSEDGEPLNERVVFMQNKDNLDLKLEPKNSNQTIDIQAITQKDKTPSTGSFSAAVFNEDKVPFDEQTEPTIISTLLLSNELHGNITNASHYLTNADDLDLLMLTQGYRTLEWKKIDTVSFKAKYFEDGLTLSGILTTQDNKPIAGGKISVISAQMGLKIDTLTGPSGNFSINDLDIFGRTQLIVKGFRGKDPDVKISISNPDVKVSHIKTYRHYAADSINTKLRDALQKSYLEEQQNYNRIKSKQLTEVNIKDKPVSRLQDISTSANLNGPGHADKILYGKDLRGFGTVGESLTSKIPFSRISPNGSFSILNKGTSATAIIIDGVAGSINWSSLSPDDVYSVEVLLSSNYLAIYGIHGSALIITTKHGVADFDREVEKSPGLISFTYNGYYKARTFYQPKYEANITPQPSAIYWKPDIFTDKDGKATLNFNNAGKGHYRVIVEGIDGEGRLGHAEYKYEVK